MHVVGLGLAVLKGTAHAHPARLHLDERGPVGDRRLALVDPVAARVLRTVENPGLMALRVEVRVDGTHENHSGHDNDHDGDGGHDGDRTGGREVVVVDVPGHGRVEAPLVPTAVLRADYWGRERELEVVGGPSAAALTAALSAHLGRPVVLARAGRRDVVYGEGVTLVTTSSLEELERRRAATGVGGPERTLPTLLVDAERWRATAVVATPGAPAFVEDGWHGARLRLGAVELQVTAGVARCAVVRGRPGDGAREDWDPLALLARDRLVDSPTGREVVFAVGAEVVRPGRVAVGDEVVVLG